MFLVFDSELERVRSFGHFEVVGPWFQITISSSQDPDDQRTAILKDAFTLQRYLARVEGVRIQDVHICTSGDLNGTKSPRLDRLLEAWHATEPVAIFEAMVYVTSGGTYIDGEVEDLESMQKEVLYSTNPKPVEIFGPDFFHGTSQKSLRLLGAVRYSSTE